MKLKINLNIITKISIFTFILFGIISLFNIGLKTEPIYMYLNSQKLNSIIGFSLLGLGIILSIWLSVSMCIKSNYLTFENFLIFSFLCLAMDVLLGGNVLFMSFNVLNMIVLAINVIKNKR